LAFGEHLATEEFEREFGVSVQGEMTGLTAFILSEQEPQLKPIVGASGHRCKGIGFRVLHHALEEAKGLSTLRQGDARRSERR